MGLRFFSDPGKPLTIYGHAAAERHSDFRSVPLNIETDEQDKRDRFRCAGILWGNWGPCLQANLSGVAAAGQARGTEYFRDRSGKIGLDAGSAEAAANASGSKPPAASLHYLAI